MKRVVRTVLCAAALATASGAIGAGEFDKAIEARQAYMALVGFQMGNLGAMAKGKAPYDAKAAQSYAGNMLALAKMDTQALWPKGSDNVANPGMTRAKPEAWSTYPEVREKHEAWAEASAKLAATAGDGLEALKGAMGDVGKTCGGCHKPFRAPKDK